MGISIEYEISNELQRFVANSGNLFALFDQVYLFGSVLIEKSNPNDIDMLLVYLDDTEKILTCLYDIREQVNDKFKHRLDLTVLSQRELEETQFLRRIQHFKRIK